MDLLNERLEDSFFHVYEFDTLKFVWTWVFVWTWEFDKAEFL